MKINKGLQFIINTNKLLNLSLNYGNKSTPKNIV